MAADARSEANAEGATRVVIVPGAAVRDYVRPLADVLSRRGIATRLLHGPGQPGVPSDLAAYGERLGAELRSGNGVDLLVGLSVGSQAATVAAAVAGESGARRLLIVSPTVDPERRTVVGFLGRWAAAGRLEEPTLLAQQLPEWR